jgi:hypothetical protein
VLADLRQHVVLPPEQAEWVGGAIDEILEQAADQPELIGSWSLWKLPGPGLPGAAGLRAQR